MLGFLGFLGFLGQRFRIYSSLFPGFCLGALNLPLLLTLALFLLARHSAGPRFAIRLLRLIFFLGPFLGFFHLLRRNRLVLTGHCARPGHHGGHPDGQHQPARKRGRLSWHVHIVLRCGLPPSPWTTRAAGSAHQIDAGSMPAARRAAIGSEACPTYARRAREAELSSSATAIFTSRQAQCSGKEGPRRYSM